MGAGVAYVVTLAIVKLSDLCLGQVAERVRNPFEHVHAAGLAGASQRI
jgi:hypothetical protein